jgi:hypothetical protein
MAPACRDGSTTVAPNQLPNAQAPLCGKCKVEGKFWYRLDRGAGVPPVHLYDCPICGQVLYYQMVEGEFVPWQ